VTGALKLGLAVGGPIAAGVLLLRLWIPTGDQVLEIAVAEENGPVLRAAANDFHKRHREIEVQLDERPYDDVHDYVFAAVNGTDRKIHYDAVMVDQPWVAALRGGLAPLSVDGGGVFPESVLASLKSSGCGGPPDFACLVGMPYVGNSQLFAMNRRLLPAAKWPGDWNDVVDLARGFHAPSAYAYALRGKFDDESAVTDEFMPVFWAFSQNGRTSTFAAAAAAAHTLRSLAAASPSPLGVYASYDVSALLLHGNIAMGMTWSDWAMRMTDADPQAARDLEFGPMPGGAPELGIWAIAIPRNTRHEKEAEEFVRFATTREELKKSARNGNPPIRLDLFEDAELAARYPTFKAQRESLIAARTRPAGEHWHDCSEIKIAHALSGFYFGELMLAGSASGIREALATCR
jgi:multiple sugar transport system substrate-binding protein